MRSINVAISFLIVSLWINECFMADAHLLLRDLSAGRFLSSEDPSSIDEATCFHSCPVPTGSLWNQNKSVSLPWATYMKKEALYQCNLPFDPQHIDATKPINALSLAEEFPNVKLLSYFARRDLRNILAELDDEQYDAWLDYFRNSYSQLSDNPLQSIYTLKAIFHTWTIGLMAAYFGIFTVIVTLFLLCLSKLCCRRKLFCVYQSRPNLNEHPKRILVAVLIGLFFFVFPILFTSISLGASMGIGPSLQLAICQVYRLTHVAMFGVGHDQLEYERRSGLGARGTVIPRPFKGMVTALNLVDELVSNVTDSSSHDTVIFNAVQLVDSTKLQFISAIHAERETLENLLNSLEKTKVGHEHSCILCSSDELRNKIRHVIRLLVSLEGTIKELHDGFLEHLRSTPIITDTINEINQKISNSKGIADGVRSFYKIADRQGDFVANLLHYIRHSFMIVTVLSAVGLLFAAIVVILLCKQYKQRRTAYSPCLKNVLQCQWVTLMLGSSLLLVLGGFILHAVSFVSQPCDLVVNELMDRGDYENLPYALNRVASLLNSNEKDILQTLKNTLTFRGNGTLKLDVIDRIRSELDNGLHDGDTYLDQFLKDVDSNLTAMALPALERELLQIAWLIPIDFVNADAMELITYKEVIMSGIQENRVTLSSFVKDILSGTLSDVVPKDIPMDTIYGLKDIENKINEVLNAANPIEAKNWCIQYYDDCKASLPGKILGKDFNANSDVEVKEVVESFSKAYKVMEATQFQNAMLWIERKLAILHGADFYSIANGGKVSMLPYVQWADPNYSNSESSQYLNQLIRSSIVKFANKVLDITTVTVRTGQSILVDLGQLIQRTLLLLDEEKSILVEAFTLVDPVCSGVLGNLARISVLWIALAFVQLLASVLSFKIWRYEEDLGIEERSTKSKHHSVWTTSNLSLVDEGKEMVVNVSEPFYKGSPK